MLRSTKTTGQQIGKTSTLSLSTINCQSSESACVKSNTTLLNENTCVSPNNLAIMSSSLDVSTPASTTTVSPLNSNTNGNNLQCSSSGSQKYETPYGANVTSPCNIDVNNGQNLDDTNVINKIKNKSSNGVSLAAMDSTSRGERDSLSNISSNTLIRQSSASTNSCSVQFNESSPNNGDSSNSSSTVSHLNNDNKSNDEEKLSNNQTTKNSTIIKEEERDKNISSSSSGTGSGNANTNALLSMPTSLSSLKPGLNAVVKDEKDSVKKEETSLSPPNMSPVGFGSIGGSQINECGDSSGSAAKKTNDSSSSSDKQRMNLSGNICNDIDDSSVNQSNVGHIVPGSGANLSLLNSSINTNANPLNSKSSADGFCPDPSTSTPISSNTPNTSCNIPLNASFILNNLSNNTNTSHGNNGGGNIISGGNGGINNCMDYMQQQNHIFVFSTQLANKGAEAVIAGQFPTIIAYHCTQPATKSFFEDFFLKNPMKMTKLQRQNTLNIMGGLPTSAGPGSGVQLPWLAGNCNSVGKVSHKQTLNKSETITTSATSSTTGGAGGLNENDMMCWDQTRSVIDNSAGDTANAENSSNAAKAALSASISSDENGGIPSLQGVKVPDENLTPQQRQHREEQLAKLKKMNQFLFPENGGNDFHGQAPGSNSMMPGKLQIPPEALAGGMSGNPVALLNMQNANIANKLNAAAMRNISGNLMNHAKANAANSQLDNMPNLGEDIIMPSDIMGSSGCGPSDMPAIQPSLKSGCMPGVNNSCGLGANNGRGLLNTGGANLNMMGNSGGLGMPPGVLMNDPNNAMMGNNSDMLSSFNTNHCAPSAPEGGVSAGGGMIGSHKNMNAPLALPADISTAEGMSQMEWSKLHHHIYEERLKNNHPHPNNMSAEISAGGATGCQQTLTRCNSTGIGGGAGSISHRNHNSASNNRNNQGPPPPYHPTQRSASVPIATQSPNPASPNNPTSNMSLPSPLASNSMGSTLSKTTSPNMDVLAAGSTSAVNTNSTTTSTTASISGGSSGCNGTANKNTFSQQGSPSTGSAGGNLNRNRSSVNNLNSNPTTPLTHLSPKDIESKNMNTTPTSDHKLNRPNSQRSRSPLLNDIPNNNTMETRFPSPGLNFTPGGANVANSQNMPNNFKNQNLEHRQNIQQMQPQFCRRTDNMPLNPNSSRNNQTKLANSFDPISSLAQMSQQLTGGGGVGLNSGGMGSASNNMSGLMGGPGGVSDINMNGLMGGPMMGGPVDQSMEHCNQNASGATMAMSGLGVGPGSVSGPFGPSNCNMMGGNPGPICQRLLSPKMCGPNMSGGFNPNQVPGMSMRDGPSGFPGIMPTHRMMNHRMSANFGNFSVSPNIQVKASTPNTIQYMPVRPQNNNNSNLRVPPSLEFLQRYANPHMMVNSVGGGGGPGPGGSSADMSSMNGPNGLNKISNVNNSMGVTSNAMNQMNYFGNCNQMPTMGNMGQPVGAVGGDQDELQGSGMMSNHDAMSIPGPHAPLLRGMRPMRQSGLPTGVGMNAGARMQHPSMGNMPPNSLGNNMFAGNDSDSLECNDLSSGIFNNPAAAGLYQQKNTKPPAMGMPHGPPNNGNNVHLPNNVLNDQNPSNSMQSPVIMGPNNSLLNNNMPNNNNSGPDGPLSSAGNMGYKPFVGPTSNDLKYAQQYHSFQQQLYATSTRNQQPGGGQQLQPPNAMSPNSNPNAGFFVNK